MTPEEAKPRRAVIPGVTPMDSVDTEFFTAKETAEIAAAFLESEKSDPDQMLKWLGLFKEWSK